MRTYTIKFNKAEMESYGIRTPEKQTDRIQLWLLGMSEALSVVRPDVQLTVIVGDRWWIQMRCNSDELVARIKDRLSASCGATMEPFTSA